LTFVCCVVDIVSAFHALLGKLFRLSLCDLFPTERVSSLVSTQYYRKQIIANAYHWSY